MNTAVSAAEQEARRQVTLKREQVLHELFALRALLNHLMHPSHGGQRATVRVDGDGFY